MVMPTPTPTPTDPTGERPRPGGGGSTTAAGLNQPQEMPEGSGRYYSWSSAEGRYIEVSPPPGAGLTEDLRTLGLVPFGQVREDQDAARRQAQARKVGRDPSTALTPGQFEQNVSGQDQVDQSALWVDPNTGLLYLPDGTIASKQVHDFVYGEGGPGGGSSDQYAGARDARDQTRLNEQIRAARLAEAQNAIDNQRQRMMMRLEGSQWALPPDTGGYFPGLMPTSPLVKTGLADPLRAQPVQFNADAGMDPGQIERDLAMIRGAAGVGG
jgi:hypothetical protein